MRGESDWIRSPLGGTLVTGFSSVSPWVALFLAASTLSAQTAPRFEPGDAANRALADKGVDLIEARDAAIRRAVDRAAPSVVAIFLVERESELQNFSNFNSRQREETELAAAISGAGVVLDVEGRILTAYHLVRMAVTFPLRYDLRVRLPTGEFSSISKDAIIAADPRSDLAVIQLRGMDPHSLVPIEIADGDRLFRGQTVIAIGNPFGVANLDAMTSASVGIVSNIGRRADPIIPSHLQNDGQQREKNQHLFTAGSLVQVDCRLHMGVSGGAVVDVRGRMVGIAMALAARTGLETPGGFMAPMDQLTRRCVETLKQGKEVEYGFLGISPRNFTVAEAVGNGQPMVEGVNVDSIQLAQTARAGLRTNDVIISIDGQLVRNKDELVLRVGAMPVGKFVKMHILRGTRKMDLSIRLMKFPVHGAVVATVRRPEWQGIRVDYASTIINEIQNRPTLNMPEGGVVACDVSSETTSAYPKLVKNVIISHVNKRIVDTPEEFEQAVRNAKSPVKLTLKRMETTRGMQDWASMDVEIDLSDSNNKTEKKSSNSGME